VESVAQEVDSFGIGMTIVEPGGARTEFRYGSAQVAKHMSIHDQTPAHSFLPKNGLAPGDPARMAARIIESVDVEPAPAHGARLTGAGRHTDDTAQADRQLRGADCSRGFDGLPAWCVTA
jgi:NAD(P)-dependent dehydrogenase (short-subunit alcohol dehydrogenase family)